MIEKVAVRADRWSPQFKFEVTTAMRAGFTPTQIAQLHYPLPKDKGRNRKLKNQAYKWAGERATREKAGKVAPLEIWPDWSGRRPTSLSPKDSARLKKLFTVSS